MFISKEAKIEKKFEVKMKIKPNVSLKKKYVKMGKYLKKICIHALYIYKISKSIL